MQPATAPVRRALPAIAVLLLASVFASPVAARPGETVPAAPLAPTMTTSDSTVARHATSAATATKPGAGYASREARAKKLETFDGGGTAIYLSSGAAVVLIVLIVLLIVF